MARDDFTQTTKNLISARAAYRCSNPGCQRPTKGPDNDGGVASIGVAAHIAAASKNGPRFNPKMSAEERCDSSNGIWLCQTCSRLIDSDEAGYPVDKLQEWKAIRELSAALELRGLEVSKSRNYDTLEQKLPELVNEMRIDLLEQPLVREFFCMGKQMVSGGNDVPMFIYYFEDHEMLLSKLQIMENYGAIFDSSINDVVRYRFNEDFIDYLLPRTS